MINREREEVGVGNNSVSAPSMHSSFHHNSSQGHQQPSIRAGFSEIETQHPSRASSDTTQRLMSTNPSCSNNPLLAHGTDLFFHNDGVGTGGEVAHQSQQQQSSSSSSANASGSLAEALRGFQESIALVASRSGSHHQSQGIHFHRHPVASNCNPMIAKPSLARAGPPSTSVSGLASASVPASASAAADAASAWANNKTTAATKKKATKKKKQKGGWRKPSDKPKRPLSAYNIFFQHEREKIVAAAESPGGDEASVPSIATETRGVPMAALTKAVYTGVNDQLQSSKEGSAAPAPSAVQHQRAFTATASPTAVQTIRTLQKIILRSRGQTKGTADKAKLSRSHTKTHGKISFVDLAKTVARKWRELDPASKAVYNSLADMERNLYKEKVKVWEHKKKAEAEVEADNKVTVADDPQKSSAAQATAAADKKPPLDDENADRMRRILENANRHGSIHNIDSSSSSDDDGLLDQESGANGAGGDLFADFALPLDDYHHPPIPVPGSNPTSTTRAGMSMSQIPSYMHGMHAANSANHQQDQLPSSTARVSCETSSGAATAIGASSLDSMFDDMFGTDDDIAAQEKSTSQLKDTVIEVTAQHQHQHHPLAKSGGDDMFFGFASDYAPAAGAAELNILSPSIQPQLNAVGDDATSSAAAAAMNNPMFDPLRIHAEGAAAHVNQSHSTQGSDPHGLNEFLRWAFQNN